MYHIARRGVENSKNCPTETPVLLGENSPPTLMTLQYDFYGVGGIPRNASKVLQMFTKVLDKK